MVEVVDETWTFGAEPCQDPAALGVHVLDTMGRDAGCMTTTIDLPLVPADLAADVDLALRAAAVGLAVARGDGDRGVLRLKGPNDLVTAVDLATEAAVVGARAAGSLREPGLACRAWQERSRHSCGRLFKRVDFAA